jgi:hypothetical protein
MEEPIENKSHRVVMTIGESIVRAKRELDMSSIIELSQVYRELFKPQTPQKLPDELDCKYLTEVRRFVLKEDCAPKLSSNNKYEYLTQWGHNPSLEKISTMSEFGLKGDVLEEIFDEPGHFVNVTKLKRLLDEDIRYSSYIKHIEKGNLPSAAIRYMRLQAYCKHLQININQNLGELKKHTLSLIVNLVNTKKVLLNLEALPSVPTNDSLQITDLNYCSIKLKSTLNRKIKNLAKVNEEITNLKAIMNIDNDNK